MTPEEIQQALWKNNAEPHGSVRNARAEELAAAAERSGEAGLLRQALFNLIDAYEYSAERTRMTVPFARLLQEYDREPSAFVEAHGLFWRFKWVTGRIVESPEIPLEAVERWLVDMERRYRVAGYSERAVRQAEFHFADATGDMERAGRAVAGWAAAARDTMSDCHACELNNQGWYWARKGEDAKAIEVWEPVLAGRNSCMEEPERVLAHSLLPLVRLGRIDEARSHHLRGHRMSRGREGLLRAVGEHIEFCALTGNESRGLEILAESATLLGELADVEAQMDFTGGVLVLLRRLSDLGHADRPTVPFGGQVRAAGDLYELLHARTAATAARFDARNGNAHVSTRLKERIEAQPLLDALPLGVRSTALPSAPAAPRPPAATAAETAAGLDDLVARARDLRSQGHPGTGASWDRVAARVEAGGTDPDARLAADLLEHRALSAAQAGADDAPTLIAASTQAHRAAGQHGRAALAELRAVTAAASLGKAPEEIRGLLEVAVHAAEALDGDHSERVRRVATAELARVRIEAHLRARAAHEAGDHHAAGRDSLFAEEVARFAADRAADGDVARLVAEAESILAQFALEDGDPARAEELFTSAADRCVTEGCAWEAVEPLARRAALLFARGAVAEAEASARTAVEHAAELTAPEEQAAVRLTLADVLLRRGEHPEEAASYALEAAHWFDQAELSGSAGAQARLVLARSYAAADRTAEAAEVLQSALPDLLDHGDPQAVSARETLGDLLLELNDPRGAAEQYLLAADVAKNWDDPKPQAQLAHGAAEALKRAGLRAEAESAYRRSLDLWRRDGGNPVAEVRVLRSLAWLTVGDEYDEYDEEEEEADAAASAEKAEAALLRGRAFMREALDVLGETDEPQLRCERGQTWRQLAEILVQHVEDELDYAEYGEGDAGTAAARAVELRHEAVDLWTRAGEVFEALGSDALQDRFICVSRASWTERALGLTEEAVARMENLAAELEGRNDTTDLLRQVRRAVDRLRS